MSWNLKKIKYADLAIYFAHIISFVSTMVAVWSLAIVQHVVDEGSAKFASNFTMSGVQFEDVVRIFYSKIFLIVNNYYFIYMFFISVSSFPVYQIIIFYKNRSMNLDNDHIILKKSLTEFYVNAISASKLNPIDKGVIDA